MGIVDDPHPNDETGPERLLAVLAKAATEGNAQPFQTVAPPSPRCPCGCLRWGHRPDVCTGTPSQLISIPDPLVGGHEIALLMCAPCASCVEVALVGFELREGPIEAV